MACANTISGSYLVKQCTSPYLQVSCMQLPQGRSEEPRKKLCAPIGLAQSLLVLPNKTSVGIPEIQAICISPESSTKQILHAAKWQMPVRGLSGLLSLQPDYLISLLNNLRHMRLRRFLIIEIVHQEILLTKG